MKLLNLSIFCIFVLASILVFGTSTVSSTNCNSCKTAFCNNATIQTILSTTPSYANLRSPQIIQQFGYPVEEHQVTTSDGYILTMQRIPYSNSSPINPTVPKIPVFVMHGIIASSAQWFWNIPSNKALVFMLADAGYDVWIGNARGTSYSRGHIIYDADTDLEYWDFSSYEMGKFDIPAAIDYVLENTTQSSLYYIGHSLGAQQFFIAMSLNPSLNSKIRTMFGLAPAVYTGNTTNPVMKYAAPVFAPYFPNEQALNELSGGQFLPSLLQTVFPLITGLVCPVLLTNCLICTNLYYGILGSDACETNPYALPGILTHEPDSISVRTYSHSAQAIQTGEFRQYDYGSSINMQKYQQTTPPDYDWDNVNVPIVLYWGNGDDLVVPDDIAKLALRLDQLEILKENNQAGGDCFDHLDFVIGIGADVTVYQPIINIMNNRTYG